MPLVACVILVRLGAHFCPTMRPPRIASHVLSTVFFGFRSVALFACLGRPGVITSGLLYASVRPPHLGDILVLSLQPDRDYSRGLICPDGTAGDQRSARDVALLQADYSHNHRLR